MAGKVSNRRSINATSCIDVDSIDDLVRPARLGLMLGLILAGWGKKKAAVGCECETTEKRSQGLVGIEMGPDSETRARRVGFGRCLHGHDGRERHRRRR